MIQHSEQIRGLMFHKSKLEKNIIIKSKQGGGENYDPLLLRISPLLVEKTNDQNVG